MKPIRLIAAACSNMGIGKDGHLPWDLPTEFQFLLDTISTVSTPGKKNVLVWGRVCWFSCPEKVFPIPNTIHVVLSRALSSVPDKAHYLCRDFPSAVQLASQGAPADLVEVIWILGGPSVYRVKKTLSWKCNSQVAGLEVSAANILVPIPQHTFRGLVESMARWVRAVDDHGDTEALEHPWCDLVYLTDIMAEFDCDVFFPHFDRNVYRKQDRFLGVPHEIQEEKGVKFQFQVFKRI